MIPGILFSMLLQGRSFLIMVLRTVDSSFVKTSMASAAVRLSACIKKAIGTTPLKAVVFSTVKHCFILILGTINSRFRVFASTSPMILSLVYPHSFLPANTTACLFFQIYFCRTLLTSSLLSYENLKSRLAFPSTFMIEFRSMGLSSGLEDSGFMMGFFERTVFRINYSSAVLIGGVKRTPARDSDGIRVSDISASELKGIWALGVVNCEFGSLIIGVTKVINQYMLLDYLNKVQSINLVQKVLIDPQKEMNL